MADTTTTPSAPVATAASATAATGATAPTTPPDASAPKRKKQNFFVRMLKSLAKTIVFIVLVTVISLVLFMIIVDNPEAQALFSEATHGHLDKIAPFFYDLF